MRPPGEEMLNAIPRGAMPSGNWKAWQTIESVGMGTPEAPLMVMMKPSPMAGVIWMGLVSWLRGERMCGWIGGWLWV